MIAVPESVAYYWRDPVNEAALNVLGDAAEVPGDLSMDEAEQFVLAALAARRVRVDFWRMLHRLRAAVWDEAVRDAFPGARLLTYGEHQAAASGWEQLAEPSVDHAWAERVLSGVYRLRDGTHLFTAVRLTERDKDLVLQFYHWSVEETTAITDELDLGGDWSDDGGGRRITIPGLFADLRGSDQIATDPARAVARAAVTAIAGLLRDL